MGTRDWLFVWGFDASAMRAKAECSSPSLEHIVALLQPLSAGSALNPRRAVPRREIVAAGL